MDFSGRLRLIPQHIPEETTAVGFIARDDAGEVLIVEPQDRYQGVSTTFPKVGIQADESAGDALARCLREKVGEEPESIFPVPGLWATGQSQTKFFAGLLSTEWMSHSPPSPCVRFAKWKSTERAKELLLESKNADSQKRDLGVLEALDGLCISTYRRQLLVVRELHRMGFERLRPLAYMAPSGMYWRCEIWPASCFQAQDGVWPAYEALWALEQHLSLDQQARYSSSTGQVPFDWQDAVFDSPRVLAEKLLERRRELVFSGWGADPEYAEWYRRILEATEPFGVFSAFHDYSQPGDPIQLMRTPRGRTFEDPPPGEAPERL